jgi:hypothetical protein
MINATFFLFGNPDWTFCLFLENILVHAQNSPWVSTVMEDLCSITQIPWAPGRLFQLMIEIHTQGNGRGKGELTSSSMQ